MDRLQPGRVPFDTGRYAHRSREGPCFVCAILAGHPDYPHHDVYEDAATIAFLARYPTLLGYCLVAPKRHVEDWVGGLGEGENGVLDVDDSTQAALAQAIRSRL